ncbi:cobalamin synthesis protein P47K [Natrinema pellirubrum DSM 15624]|uniref:Cobalamin synthesis protein P47K n=1 Tax=Natrinema pellirubrum (strain DSM 15624 / CIP 106293 / JCM 10476 / NCIMB 786 / 157) TaxID=797303 RepID=L0JHG2_NATP1|nr:GTP-binding protein [Natrinema pellirubrum]AGB30970.1 putative GTPase, G3E family [Natrinema pellirubrum DSM 15624]ELY80647.1 cobalamin synthesis protein P47K [Natrinema pellirubrum DSM 15624]
MRTATDDGRPVTILSGSLGAGKTTLLNHLLSNAGDRSLAVLVNDMGEVNVDADLVAEGSELELDDGVAELSNGCICCELQDDLETAVVRLARDRSFDHLIVESSGISEPAPVARLFTTESRVAALYDVDTLVTVLDTPAFLEAFAGEGAPERRGDEDDRPLSDLLVEQVEVSNLVLLNKADRCSEAELEEAEELVGALQPDAETIRTEFAAVDPDRLLGAGLFDPDRVTDLPGWKRALESTDREGTDHEGDGRHDDHHGHHHPDEVYGVSSFVYRARRPFHPERFAAVLRELPRSIVRSKGTAWLADNEMRVSIAGAGPSIRATAQGPWIASLPAVERDMYRSNRPDLEWHDEHGDRRTELVFIGTDYDEAALRKGLEDALVTDAEWEDALEGPFPDEQGADVVIREP